MAMRFVVAAGAIAPSIAVAIGMLSGRVQARSCCTVEPDLDARLRDTPRADGGGNAPPRLRQFGDRGAA